jgi:hypothetical protein
MTRPWRTLRLSIGIALLLGGAAGCKPKPAEASRQPIEFNHQIHVQKHKTPCTDCHTGAKNAARAGLPSLQRCLLCHVKPQPEGEEPTAAERRVRQLAAEGAKVRWTQVTLNEGHVYFSHRVHTSLAGFSCTRCHEDVRKWKRPPTEPNPRLLSMSRCMDCHRRHGSSNRCSACHK